MAASRVARAPNSERRKTREGTPAAWARSTAPAEG